MDRGGVEVDGPTAATPTLHTLPVWLGRLDPRVAGSGSTEIWAGGQAPLLCPSFATNTDCWFPGQDWKIPGITRGYEG